MKLPSKCLSDELNRILLSLQHFPLDNRLYNAVEERDGALTTTFTTFQKTPELLMPQVVRYQ